MNKYLYKILGYSVLILVIDQCVKLILERIMELYQTIILIKGFLSITLVHNTGAAFSILSGSRIPLILIALFALIGILFYIKKEKSFNNYSIFIYSLLIGGIIGNLIDRVINGYVIDYMSFKIFNYNAPIFNFADICIVISVVFILFNTMKEDLWKK